MKAGILALVSLAVAAAGSAAAKDPTPTPVEQRVVAPSLPDQPNKEGVVRPSGSMPTDSEGYVRTNRGVIDPTSASPPPAGGASTQAPVAGPGVVGTAPTPAPPPPPHGKTTVKAAHLSVRGTVKAYEEGVSITVVEADRS